MSRASSRPIRQNIRLAPIALLQLGKEVRHGSVGVEMFAYAAAAAKHARGENIDKPDRALAAALMRQFADAVERGAPS